MKLHDEIKSVLENFPEMRDDDVLLYVMLLTKMERKTPYERRFVMYALKKLDFNTVSRCRRLVQAEPGNDHLKPSKRVAKLRNEKEERAVLTRGASIPDDKRYA